MVNIPPKKMNMVHRNLPDVPIVKKKGGESFSTLSMLVYQSGESLTILWGVKGTTRRVVKVQPAGSSYDIFSKIV